MNTKFFTGKGDGGESFVGKKQVSKNDPLVELLGEVDELNSWIGYCRVEADGFGGPKDAKFSVAGALARIQEILFIAQAEIAEIKFETPRKKFVVENHTKYLEEIIGYIDPVLPALTKFVVVGGSELSARLDVGRAISRRVERSARKAHEVQELPAPFLAFLNRLSSVLFALARYVNHELGVEERNPGYE